MDVCKARIPYFKDSSAEFLRESFHALDREDYEIDTVVFEPGDTCRSSDIVLKGVVESSLSDGHSFRRLDLLGRGSIIGIHGVIKKEQWVMRGICRSI